MNQQSLINIIRNTSSEQLAKDICDIQPIDPKLWQELENYFIEREKCEPWEDKVYDCLGEEDQETYKKYLNSPRLDSYEKNDLYRMQMWIFGEYDNDM